MTEPTTPDDLDDRPYESTEAAVGGGADGGPELGDQIAEQAQTGISSPDAAVHAGVEAPASEGNLPG